MGSYIDLPRNRGFRPPKSHAEERKASSKRGNASGVLALAAVTVVGFFLFTKPSTSVKPTQTPAAVPTVISSTTDPRIAPPQPDNAALNETIILDTPLADSKKQDTAATTPVTAAGQGYSLRVLNGSDGSYSTDQLTKRLTAAKLSVTTTGTANNSYDKSTLYYTSGHETDANAVAHALGHDTMPIEASDIAVPADVLYVIGSNEQ